MRRTGAAVIATALFGMGTAAQAAPLRTVDVPAEQAVLHPVADWSAPRAFLAAVDDPFAPERRHVPLRSTDGGRTWAALPGWPAGARATIVATTPAAPRAVWALEPEGDILRSLDGGATWRDGGTLPPVENGGTDVTLLAALADVAVAARQAFVLGAGGFSCLLASDSHVRPIEVRTTRDGGATWPLRLRSTRRHLILDVATAPDGRVLALEGTRRSGLIDVCRTPERFHDRFRVLASANGGRTWTPLGPPVAGVATRLAVDPEDAGRIAVSALGGSVRLSDDGGATWRVVARRTPPATAAFATGGALLIGSPEPGATVLRLLRGAARGVPVPGLPPEAALEAVAATGGDVLLDGGRRGPLLRSADGGESFADDVPLPASARQAVPQDAVAVAPGVVAFPGRPLLRLGPTGSLPVAGLPRSARVIGIAARGGVAVAVTRLAAYLSRDGGATWIRARARLRPIGPVAIGPGGRTVLVQTFSGMRLSRDGGRTWSGTLGSLGDEATADTGTLAIRGTRRLEVDDTGRLWEVDLLAREPGRVLLAPTSPRRELCGVTAIEEAPVPGPLVVAACGALWRVDAQGARRSATSADDVVWAIARAPGAPSRIAAAGERPGLLVSADGGRSFQHLSGTDGTVTAMAWTSASTIVLAVARAGRIVLEEHRVA